MYRVMIVDDEDVIVEGLRRTMPWAQYDCEVVATGSDGISALETLRQTKPDILFTDICMPGFDGLALIAAVRSEFDRMQVTVLSGYPNFEYAQRAIELGVARYVLKPSRFAELEEALAYMVAALSQKTPEATPAETETPPKPAQNFIVQSALGYIRQHYAEKLTLSDVADHVYVSQWHLSKLIARCTEESFSDLLNGVRMEKAKELLTDPSLTVGQISELVGFTDVTHFSRTFKKICGMSANQYRGAR